jgi:hypothetical protein
MATWTERSGRSTTEVDTPRDERIVEFLLQPRAGRAVIRLDHDDDPSAPFQVGSSRLVLRLATRVGLVTVVLGGDPQLPPSDVEAVQLTSVDVADGQVRFGQGKSQISNLPHQPALAR